MTGSDGLRQVQRRAGGGDALSGELLKLWLVAESVDDVGFPIKRAVARIGGVQRGFLIAVIGKFGFQEFEILRGCERRDGLRQERPVAGLDRF